MGEKGTKMNQLEHNHQLRNLCGDANVDERLARVDAALASRLKDLLHRHCVMRASLRTLIEASAKDDGLVDASSVQKILLDDER